MTMNFLAEYGAQADAPPGSPEAQVFRIPGGGVLPWRIPQTTSRDAPERHAAAQGLRAVAAHAAAIKAIDADPDHSDSWKAARRDEATARLCVEGGAALKRADDIIAAFETADAREAVPARLEHADFPAALLDHEIRTYVRGLDHDGQVALASELPNPKHARLVEALLRSPVPLPAWIDAPARAAWVDHRTSANPAAAKQRTEARELIQWLGTVRASVAGYLERLASDRKG